MKAPTTYARPDTKFVCTLPEWWDERASWSVFSNNRIIAAHPNHPPVIWNTETKTWDKINA